MLQRAALEVKPILCTVCRKLPLHDRSVFIDSSYFVQSCVVRIPSSVVSGIGLDRLAFRADSTLGVHTFVRSDFDEFREHQLRVRLDDLSTSRGKFDDRLSVFATSGDRRSGSVTIGSAVTIFTSILSVPLVDRTGSAYASAAASHITPQMPSATTPTQGVTFAVIIDLATFLLCRLNVCAFGCCYTVVFGPHFHPDASTNGRYYRCRSATC